MSIKLKGSSDGSVSFDAPADTSPSGSDITLTLPTSAGSANQFLKNSGIAGELEYSSMVETSTGLGIGTTAPSNALHVIDNGGTTGSVDIGPTANKARIYAASDGIRFGSVSNDDVIFRTNNTERSRLDTSGRLLIGSTSARTNFNNGTASPQIQIENVANGNKSSIALIHNENATSDSSALNFAKTRGGSVGDNSALNQSGDRLGTITFQGNDGTEFVQAASIEGLTDATPGNNDMPGKLSFRTTGDGASSTTERMRINRNGVLFLGQFATTTPGYGNTTTGIAMQPDGRIFSSMGGTFSQFNRNSNGAVLNFARSSVGVGVISVSTSSTSYGTSSDYRLKENVVALDGAIARVKQLLPKRFNFIVDADTTVDGFLAHEAQTVVPEAVTGTHDEVDDDSNPVYQCIDQSKLVPLLTAALQEAIAKIETLETKVAALEAA